MQTIRLRSAFWGLALAVAAIGLFPRTACADTPIVLTLTSDTDAIQADGHSQANISVEAWDGQTHYTGPLQVSLRTSLGDLDPTNLTLSAGTGWVHLRSGAATGTAVISAQVIAGPRQVILPAPLGVVFLPPGAHAAPVESNRFLTARADYLAFAVDMQRLVAIQHVRLSYRGVEVAADSLTLDATALILRALSLSTHPITLKSGKKTILAQRLYLNFRTGVGLALVSSPDGTASLENFTLTQFALIPLVGPAPVNAFADEGIEGASLVIHARRIDLYPQNELHAAGASIYVSGKKILSLPYYRLSLNPYSPNGDQYVTFDTYSGIGINLPIYYMLNDGAMGSIRLEHQEQAGYLGSSTQGGWSLNLRQDYGHGLGSIGQVAGSGGTFTLDRITSQDWGFSLRHNERLGRSAVFNGYLYSPDHRGLTGNFNLYAPYHGLGLSLTSFGNHQSYLDSMSSQFNIDLPQQTAFRRRVAFNFSTSLGWNYLQSKFNGTAATTAAWLPGVASNIYLAPWTIDRSTTVSPSLSARYFFPAAGAFASTNAGLGINRQLGRTGGMSLTYNWSASGASGNVPGYSHQLISSYIYDQVGTRLRWSASPSYDLTTHSTYALGSMAFNLTPVWIIDGAVQWSAGGIYGSDDWQVGISRPFLGRNLRLFYQESTHNFRFEVTAGQLGW